MIEDLFDLIAIASEGDGSGSAGEEPASQGNPDGEAQQTETKETVPTEYEIDGEKYSIDDIRSWKQGNLRQSDYTRKTQELAQQRKDNAEAIELYEYLVKNPELLNKLNEFDQERMGKATEVANNNNPALKEIQKLRQEMMMKDIDRDLAEITKADKSINDVKLLEIANKYNCSVKDAYNIYRGQNIDKIIADEKAKMKEEIIAELKANSDSTSTLITSGDKANDNGDFGLTEIELAFAEKLGMTPKEYAENKSNPW